MLHSAPSVIAMTGGAETFRTTPTSALRILTMRIGGTMHYWKTLAVSTVAAALIVGATTTSAAPAPAPSPQVSIGVNLGPAPGCPYGYFDYAPL